MFRLKSFPFYNDRNEQILVKIPEVLNSDFGTYVWPSSPVLAQFIVENQHKIKYKKILELGAGTSLPGILASKLGAKKVYLSDSSIYKDSLENCKSSCKANDILLGEQIEILDITWGQFGKDLLNLEPVDIVLGADCFYNSKDFEDLLVTISFLLDQNLAAEFWTAYQERNSGQHIGLLLKKWNLHGRRVFLSQNQSNCVNDSPTLNDDIVHLYVITKSQEKCYS